jgi:hypothetical protein
VGSIFGISTLSWKGLTSRGREFDSAKGLRQLPLACPFTALFPRKRAESAWTSHRAHMTQSYWKRIKNFFITEKPRQLESKNPYIRFLYDVLEPIIFSTIFASILGYSAFTLNPDFKVFRIDFITISISLAGFVVVGAFIDRGTKQARKSLFESSRWLVISAISFIVFYCITPFASNELTKAISIISYIIAPFTFSIGVIRLLRAITFGRYEISEEDKRVK